MPIYEVTSTDALQICVSCDRATRLPLATLQAGVPDPRGAEALAVLLPPCPQCGSVEYLFRSPDAEPEHSEPGSFGHLHRLMVDHLHSELVKADRVHPGIRDKKTGKPDPRIARAVKPADREKFFPRGLKIDRPNAPSRGPAPGPGPGTGKPGGGTIPEDPRPGPGPVTPVEE